MTSVSTEMWEALSVKLMSMSDEEAERLLRLFLAIVATVEEK